MMSKDNKPVLKADGTISLNDLEKNEYYEVNVSRRVDFGVFVDINGNIQALIRNDNLNGNKKVGEKLVGEIIKIDKNKNEVDMTEVGMNKYETKEKSKEINLSLVKEITSENAGELFKVRGEVIGVKTTGGPTIFTLTDGTGWTWAASMDSPGSRAHPHISAGDVIEVKGEVSLHQGNPQIETASMEKLRGNKSTEFRERMNEELEKRTEIEEVNFLADHSVLEKLENRMKNVAKEIKKAIHAGRPILIRHHADADGYVSGLAIEKAILPILKETSPDPDARWHYIKRRPSKAPYYELTDVLKDLIFAREDKMKFEEKMPLIVVVDNGSTEEDIPALKRLVEVYGLDVVVIDHHDPHVVEGEAPVDEYLKAHVNPYLKGGDSNLTAGMLSTEVACLINPEIKDQIKHMPAIAGKGDHSKYEGYIKHAVDKGLEEDELDKIAEVVDYESYHWKFNDGKGIIEDILMLGTLNRHRKLVNISWEELDEEKKRTKRAILPHVKEKTFSNGIKFNTLDVESYAPKFEYPAPGKICGMVHDELEEDSTVTLSYGPDFCVVRASEEMSELGFDLNKIITEIREDKPETGINGGGHEYAGSIKFFQGERDKVLKDLAKRIANL